MTARCSFAPHVFFVAFAVVPTIASQAAYAQGSPTDSALAQALFEQGKKLMSAGKFAEACPKLEESQRLDPGSGTLLNLGDCYEHLAMFATAWGKYIEAASAAKAAGNPARERVSRERALAVRTRVSNIVVDVADMTSGLEVKRDGAVVGKAQWATPMPADPGEHKVSASAPGKKSWETTVTVGGTAQTFMVSVPRLDALETSGPPSRPGSLPPTGVGETHDGAVTPPAQPASVDEGNPGLGTQRVLAIGVAVVGLGGLAMGTVFGLQSKSKHDEAAPRCVGGCDDDHGVDLMNEARAAGNVSTVAFIVGIAGVGGAAALWLTAPKVSTGSATTQLGVGPSGIALKANW